MNSSLSLSLAQFGQILRIPYNSQVVFTNEWDLTSLAYSQETEGPYHANLPTLDDIRRFLQLNRVKLNRTMKSQNVILTPNQILTKELRDDDEDDGASRASTPSPTTYLNSLKPLNYQRYKIPSPSQQNDDLLFE
ncbi:hypothetical protein Tco_1398382 [Tanacetum coccineum]